MFHEKSLYFNNDKRILIKFVVLFLIYANDALEIYHICLAIVPLLEQE